MRASDKDDPCHCTVQLTFRGMAGYRIRGYAKAHNISENLAAKEIMLEGLKALDLLHRKYSLSDMRKGA